MILRVTGAGRARGIVERSEKATLTGTPDPPPRRPPVRPSPPPLPPEPHRPGAPTPWYWQTRVVVLALILVFPAGLALLWTRKPPWSQGVRWGTTSVVVGLAAIVIAGVSASAPRVSTTPDSAVAQSTPGVARDAPQSTDLFSPGTTALPAPTPPATAPPPAAPTPLPTRACAPPPPPPTAKVDLCGAPPNPWNYNFCGGALIASPPSNFCNFFNCIQAFWQSATGYVVQCGDGMYSHAGGRSGACASHGGARRPLFS